MPCRMPREPSGTVAGSSPEAIYHSLRRRRPQISETWMRTTSRTWKKLLMMNSMQPIARTRRKVASRCMHRSLAVAAGLECQTRKCVFVLNQILEFYSRRPDDMGHALVNEQAITIQRQPRTLRRGDPCSQPSLTCTGELGGGSVSLTF